MEYTGGGGESDLAAHGYLVLLLGARDHRPGHRGLAELDVPAVRLGFGHIVASEIEALNMLVNLV